METLTTYDEDGMEVEVPAKWVVCPQCKGKGSSSAYLGAFTWDDEHMRDPDFREAYFAGDYDRACETCEGRTTVLTLDEDRATEEERHCYYNEQRQLAELRAMEAMERRMGC